MRIAQHGSVQRDAALIGLSQLGGAYPQAVSCDLNVRFVLRGTSKPSIEVGIIGREGMTGLAIVSWRLRTQTRIR